jgi:NAD(P)-dependent dehydrogenase (short-subunit alcohol dehydrogenase family)
MRVRNWGRVVFVSSESVVQIPAEMIHYGMTKTAQLAIARGVAEAVAGTSITVNCVLPGPTESVTSQKPRGNWPLSKPDLMLIFSHGREARHPDGLRR